MALRFLPKHGLAEVLGSAQRPALRNGEAIVKATQRIALQIAAALLLINLPLILTGCDARTIVTGTVTNPEGEPIGGADITLGLGTTIVRSGETSADDGSFEIGGTHAGTRRQLTLLVKKDGFQDRTESVSAGGSHSVKVVLEPVSTEEKE
jgi:Carboxypeptidase regulatory-like domain